MKIGDHSQLLGGRSCPNWVSEIKHVAPTNTLSLNSDQLSIHLEPSARTLPCWKSQLNHFLSPIHCGASLPGNRLHDAVVCGLRQPLGLKESPGGWKFPFTWWFIVCSWSGSHCHHQCPDNNSLFSAALPLDEVVAKGSFTDFLICPRWSFISSNWLVSIKLTLLKILLADL